MSLESECRKIWEDGEEEPAGDLMHNTEAPKNWFKDLPVQEAVELFAVEKRYMPHERHVVHVRTGWGSVESYEVKIVLEPVVKMEIL